MPVKVLLNSGGINCAKICYLHAMKRICQPTSNFQKLNRHLYNGLPKISLVYIRKPKVRRISHESKFGTISAKQFNDPKMSLPMLVYVYSPWKYITTKWNVWKLKLLWDSSFNEVEFIQNARQAAVVLTNIIRLRQSNNIVKCTTPMGFKQITHDLIGPNIEPRLQLLRFDDKHIHRSIPLKIKMLRHYDHKYVFIDMFFVGLRHIKDFSTPREIQEMNDLVSALKLQSVVGQSEYAAPNPLIFAEIFVRFRRDYSKHPEVVPVSNNLCNQWLVSSYKILQFDILNYNPYTTQLLG